MHTMNKTAAQGDVLIIRINNIPTTAKLQPREGKLVVTHSETGHHHVIERSRVDMYAGDDPLVAWLEVHDVEDLPQIAELVHERPWDTHESIGLTPGKYEIRRQREYVPEGWRQVQD
jgi:hypothetical protein